MAESNIRVDIESLFPKVKSRSELRSRSLNPELGDVFVITQTDKKFFSENINSVVLTEVANHLTDTIRVDESGAKFSLDTDTFGTESKRYIALLEEAIIQGMLGEWCKHVGFFEMYQGYYQDFRNRIDQFKKHTGTVVSVKRTPLSF